MLSILHWIIDESVDGTKYGLNSQVLPVEDESIASHGHAGSIAGLVEGDG